MCHGNICRSPFAAAVLRTESAVRLTVESAGFIGPDRPTPPAGIEVAGEFGIDLSGHRSRLLTPQAARAADLVVVMEPRQARLCAAFGRRDRVVVLGDLDPDAVAERAIPDPIGGDAAAFRACYARIRRCVVELARALAEACSASAQGGRRAPTRT